MTAEIGTLLETVNTGHVAARTLADLDPFIEKRAGEINERVFSILRKGDALPVDLAVQAWYDKYALISLRSSLIRAVKRGHNASAKVDYTPTEGQNG